MELQKNCWTSHHTVVQFGFFWKYDHCQAILARKMNDGTNTGRAMAQFSPNIAPPLGEIALPKSVIHRKVSFRDFICSKSVFQMFQTRACFAPKKQ
jgi:hypothetical protein